MRALLLFSSALLISTSLGACTSVLVDEDTSCTEEVVTKTSLLPVLPEDATSSDGVKFLGLQCRTSSADLDASSRADCIVIAARRTTGAPACDPSDGLVAVSPEHQDAVDRLQMGADAKSRGWNEFCEMVQLDPASVGGQACRDDEGEVVYDEDGQQARGFCYLDAFSSPHIGDEKLLANCPVDGKRAIRFTGSSAAVPSKESKSLTVVCFNEVCPVR